MNSVAQEECLSMRGGSGGCGGTNERSHWPVFWDQEHVDDVDCVEADDLNGCCELTDMTGICEV